MSVRIGVGHIWRVCGNFAQSVVSVSEYEPLNKVAIGFAVEYLFSIVIHRRHQIPSEMDGYQIYCKEFAKHHDLSVTVKILEREVQSLQGYLVWSRLLVMSSC